MRSIDASAENRSLERAAVRGANSPYVAGFVDGDCCCGDWKARLKK